MNKMAHLTFAKIEIRKMNQKLLLIIQIRGMRLIKIRNENEK